MKENFLQRKLRGKRNLEVIVKQGRKNIKEVQYIEKKDGWLRMKRNEMMCYW